MAGRILHALLAVSLLSGCIGSGGAPTGPPNPGPAAAGCATPGVAFADDFSEAAGFEGEAAFVLGAGCQVEVQLEVHRRVGELAIDIAGGERTLLRYRAEGIGASSMELAGFDGDHSMAQGDAPAGVYLYRVEASHVAAFTLRVVAS